MNEIRLIAVVGGSGSGKSWLAADLVDGLGDEATQLCLDDFYLDLGHLPLPERAQVNFDHPAAIDWNALCLVLETLERGEIARVPVYNFAEHVRTGETAEIASRPIVVLEGLWLLYPEWLREKFSMSVYVDCPEEVRLLRRMERDVMTRNRTAESVREQFANQVQPMHAAYVEPQRELAMLCVTSPLMEDERSALRLACRG